MSGSRHWESGFRPEWQPLPGEQGVHSDNVVGPEYAPGATGADGPDGDDLSELFTALDIADTGTIPVVDPSQPQPTASSSLRGERLSGQRRSSLWPAIAGALGMALVVALGFLGWLIFGDDSSDESNQVAATATPGAAAPAGPGPDDLAQGAEQLRVMLRGMNLTNVDVDVRDSVLYLVGTVPSDAEFADAVLAAGALPSVNQVNFTELTSEQSSGFTIDTTPTDTDAVNEANENAPLASAEQRQALQDELSAVLAEVPLRFEPGSAEPDDLTGAVLQTAVATLLNSYPGTQLLITGHTDASGSDEDNLLLSRERADAVKEMLVAQGIAEARLVTVGQGAANATGDKDLDRRVEIEVVLG